MDLVLDRMALDDVGANSERLAEAIHAQLVPVPVPGPTPIEMIARALDIVEIRAEPLTHFEGALLTDRHRSRGAILVNRCSSPQRRRFTIGHELGHFLSPHHVAGAENGFRCSRSDMALGAAMTPYERQEAEANSFAIALLAPRRAMRRYLHTSPDLGRVLAIAESFDISREAAARRYVELHGEALAVVFGREDRVRYISWSTEFPQLCLRKDHLLPELPQPADAGMVSDIEDADARDWIIVREAVRLTIQTLHQANGHTMTLLHSENGEAEQRAEGSMADAFEGITKFSTR